jgi:hypothetical protein
LTTCSPEWASSTPAADNNRFSLWLAMAALKVLSTAVFGAQLLLFIFETPAAYLLTCFPQLNPTHLE